jgi:DNA-directed RNA polymerase subunit RPC12/RpoP
MDYRCPICRTDLGRRKLIASIVAQMETDCAKCGARIRLNIHSVETAVVLFGFGAIAVLGLLAWWTQSHGLALATFGAAMLGSVVLPLLERTYLREWPRYLPAVKIKPD